MKKRLNNELIRNVIFYLKKTLICISPIDLIACVYTEHNPVLMSFYFCISVFNFSLIFIVTCFQKVSQEDQLGSEVPHLRDKKSNKISINKSYLPPQDSITITILYRKINIAVKKQII